MILPDVSILIHAHNLDSRHHDRAREWWDDALSETELVGLAWVTLLGFIRITTNRAALEIPGQSARLSNASRRGSRSRTCGSCTRPIDTPTCCSRSSAAWAPPAGRPG